MRQQNPFKRILIKTGSLSILAFFVLVFVLYLLHQQNIVNAYQFPIKPIAAFLVTGGIICLFLGLILEIRRKQVILLLVLTIFVTVNILAYAGVYALTHFVPNDVSGIGLPRPSNSRSPTDVGLDYDVHRISINPYEWIETWLIPSQNSSPHGTVLLFPGNGGSKGSQLLLASKIFHSLGYNSLLIDFRGVGGSSGNTTTIGANEAKDVVLAMNYIQQENFHAPIILYGVSMGSAAILRAIAQDNIAPDAIILELPFVRLIDAIGSRLREFGIPTFPTAELLVFWGSIQHGFNGFSHNPVNYAKEVKCPALVIHGKQDKWTSTSEIEELLQNLSGPKELITFHRAGHQLLVTVDRELWYRSVSDFLRSINFN